MKGRTLVLLMISCLFLSGCWDHHEPERLLYVNALGVDYKENGEVEVFLQLINLQSLAKQESGDGPKSKEQAEIGTARGKTMEDAIFNLYHTVDRRVFLGHLSYVVLSKAAVEKGAMRDVSDFIDRFRETRYHTYFFVTEDPLRDIMLVEPMDNISLAFSKLSDPEDNYKQTSFIEPMNLRKMIISTDEPGHQTLLPVLKITEQWKDKKGKKKDILIEEVAVIYQNTLLDIIPKEKFRGARGIEKNFVRDIVLVTSDKNDYFSAIVYDKHVKVKPFMENGSVRFDIEMKIKAILQMTKTPKTKQEFENEVRKTIKNEIRTSYNYARKKNIDIYKLSETLYRKNNKVWKKVEREGLVPLKKDTIRNINIHLELQNTGRNNIEVLFDGQKNEGIKKRFPADE
nr:Ger(x)C family spore germination protein [uncultured Bacillus sp.]